MECGKQREATVLPGETAALLPEFVMEDLSSAELLPRFLRLQRRTCPWEEQSNGDDDDDGIIKKIVSF